MYARLDQKCPEAGKSKLALASGFMLVFGLVLFNAILFTGEPEVSFSEREDEHVKPAKDSDPDLSLTFSDANVGFIQEPTREKVEGIQEPMSSSSFPSKIIKEKDFYRAYLKVARTEEGALEEVAESILMGKNSVPQQTALLRALYDTRSPQAMEFFSLAIEYLPDISRPQGVSIPEFAVAFLGKKSPRDPKVRRVFEGVIQSRNRKLSPSLRRRAAAYLAATGTESDLYRLASLICQEQDPLLLESVAASLAKNPNREKALFIFSDLNLKSHSD